MKKNNYIELIEDKLNEYIEIEYPQSLFKSMKYTVMLPGKRLRPIMCLETCRIFGGEIEDALPTACAIEMLHAQTLIHDDLPCMDNDDFRRGKPSNHKVFGEAIATLAGDALLTFAPQIITKHSQNIFQRCDHEGSTLVGAWQPNKKVRKISLPSGRISFGG